MTDQAGPSGSGGASGGGGGAGGGSGTPTDDEKSRTLAELIAMQENEGAIPVIPKAWCPHLEDNVDKVIRSFAPGVKLSEQPCLQCGNVGENWICCRCHEVHCSRYVNEHMLFHGIEKGHLICVSFSDLSAWCYGCEDYIDHADLDPYKQILHMEKFGTAMPVKASGMGASLTLGEVSDSSDD